MSTMEHVYLDLRLGFTLKRLEVHLRERSLSSMFLEVRLLSPHVALRLSVLIAREHTNS